MIEEVKQIIDWILSPEVQQTLLPFRILFFLVGLFFVGFLIFFLFKTPWFKYAIWWDLVELFTRRPYGAIRASGFWKRTKGKVDKLSGKNLDKKLIKADKHLGKLLKRLVPNLQADSFDDKLDMLGEATFSEIDKIKKAHIIAKTIREGGEVNAEQEEKRSNLKVFGQAFEELSILAPIEK